MLSLTPLLALARQEPGPSLDPEALQDALDSIFAQPAFQHELERADRQALSPMQVLLERVLDLFRRFNDWLSDLHVSSPPLYWLVLTGLVVLLLALVAHIAWTFRRAFRPDLPAGEGPVGAEEHERAARYRELREHSTRLASEGALREAARALLLALLALIEERKVLSLARGWTNREILQRLTLPAAEGAALDGFRRGVEDAWYGGHPLDRAQFAELAVCVDRCAQVLRAPRGSEVR